MNRRRLLVGGAALGGIALTGCSTGARTPTPSSTSPSSPTSPSATPTTEPVAIDPVVESTVATGLNVPWAIAFLADGDAVVTQRDTASIVRVGRDGTVVELGSVASVVPRGEGGLQGVAFAPGDESELYAYVTTATENRVVRMSFDGEHLGALEPVLTGIPKAAHHNGGALIFDDAGHLFVAVGDALDADRAQDRSAVNGKILRIDRDGQPVDGNPFDSEVWSYGHRNVEGLAFDAEGRLWATEFGEKSADELNLIEAGGNYGWPRVEGSSDDSRYLAPKATWEPTAVCSPAGLAIVGGRAFVGALIGARLYTVDLDGENAAEPRGHLHDTYGRLRSVAAAADGTVWVGTSNTDGRTSPRSGDDRILRLRITA